MKILTLLEAGWKAHPTRKGVLMRKVDLKAEEQKKIEAEAEKARKKAEREFKAKQKTDLNSKALFLISQKVSAEVSETFPDGDPISSIIKWVMKKFDVDMSKAQTMIDKAIKTHLGAKDYYEYQKEFWDQIADDKIVDGVTRENNPW